MKTNPYLPSNNTHSEGLAKGGSKYGSEKTNAKFPRSYFKRPDEEEFRADRYGLEDVEDMNLTTEGKMAKLKILEESNGSEYVIKGLKKQLGINNSDSVEQTGVQASGGYVVYLTDMQSEGQAEGTGRAMVSDGSAKSYRVRKGRKTLGLGGAGQQYWVLDIKNSDPEDHIDTSLQDKWDAMSQEKRAQFLSKNAYDYWSERYKAGAYENSTDKGLSRGVGRFGTAVENMSKVDNADPVDCEGKSCDMAYAADQMTEWHGKQYCPECQKRMGLENADNPSKPTYKCRACSFETKDLMKASEHEDTLDGNDHRIDTIKNASGEQLNLLIESDYERKTIPLSSLTEAPSKYRQYVESESMGSSEVSQGKVVQGSDLVATISYNGNMVLENEDKSKCTNPDCKCGPDCDISKDCPSLSKEHKNSGNTTNEGKTIDQVSVELTGKKYRELGDDSSDQEMVMSEFEKSGGVAQQAFSNSPSDATLSRLASAAMEIAANGASQYAGGSGAKLDAGKLLPILRENVKQFMDEALRDSKEALDANMGQVAETMFKAAMTQAGIEAAKELISRGNSTVSNGISIAQWEELGSEYAKSETISTKNARKLSEIISTANDEAVKELATRNIKFVSVVAQNELFRRGLKNEIEKDHLSDDAADLEDIQRKSEDIEEAVDEMVDRDKGEMENAGWSPEVESLIKKVDELQRKEASATGSEKESLGKEVLVALKELSAAQKKDMGKIGLSNSIAWKSDRVKKGASLYGSDRKAEVRNGKVEVCNAPRLKTSYKDTPAEKARAEKEADYYRSHGVTAELKKGSDPEYPIELWLEGTAENSLPRTQPHSTSSTANAVQGDNQSSMDIMQHIVMEHGCEMAQECRMDNAPKEAVDAISEIATITGMSNDDIIDDYILGGSVTPIEEGAEVGKKVEAALKAADTVGEPWAVANWMKGKGYV